MSKEQQFRKDDEITEVFEGSLNGFSRANKLVRRGISSFSLTFDGTNYSPDISIPEKGEFMVLPTDILEKVHFYIYFRYERQGLESFSFALFHKQDKNGQFEGKKYEIGSEAVLKDFIRQPDFRKLYTEGSVFYKLDDQDYFFGINKENKDISFAVNSRLFAEVPIKHTEENLNARIFLPYSRVRK